jgi:hypothetical protein
MQDTSDGTMAYVISSPLDDSSVNESVARTYITLQNGAESRRVAAYANSRYDT